MIASGRSVALNVLRKDRSVEAFLVPIPRMDWAKVDGEAETLEHALSDRVLARIDGLFGHPAADPHGFKSVLLAPPGRLEGNGGLSREPSLFLHRFHLAL